MDATEKLRAFLVELSIWKKEAEAEILTDTEMLEKCFTKMELRYKILCQIL
jgi:hypothetical protein